jgi:hypothetical protein
MLHPDAACKIGKPLDSPGAAERPRGARDIIHLMLRFVFLLDQAGGLLFLDELLHRLGLGSFGHHNCTGFRHAGLRD